MDTKFIIQILAGSGIIMALLRFCISDYKIRQDFKALSARFEKLSTDSQKERQDHTDTLNGLREYYEGEINRYKNEWKIAHESVERAYACGYMPKEVIEEMRAIRRNLPD